MPPALPRPQPPAPKNNSPLRQNWWFVLGREPLLSMAEIISALKIDLAGAKDNCQYQPPILKMSADLNPAELIARLGGTIKIAEEIISDAKEKNLLDTMTKELETVVGKIHFGISLSGGAALSSSPRRRGADGEILLVERWGKEIKRRLKATGRSARFVFNRESILSSVTVEKNGLTKRGREFLINSSPSQRRGQGEVSSFALAITRAVQPFEAFSARDYGRPGRDDQSGMLPPKLAMMMINLGISNFSRHGGIPPATGQFPIILDPFCGSGTILTEAMLLGYKNIIGSDISDKATADTQKNITWTQSTLPATGFRLSANIFQSDIRGLSKKMTAHSIDAILTEPYLGPPLTGREPRTQLDKTTGELSGLYLAAFGEFKKILKADGVVVFIMPRFFIGGLTLTISDKIIPQIKKLGFISERLLPAEIRSEPFILYHRPGQFVGREIWRFKMVG